MNAKLINITKNKPIYRVIVKNAPIDRDNSKIRNISYFVIFCYKFIEEIDPDDVWIIFNEIKYNKLVKSMKKSLSLLPSNINLNLPQPLEIQLIRFRVERIDSFLL